MLLDASTYIFGLAESCAMDHHSDSTRRHAEISFCHSKSLGLCSVGELEPGYSVESNGPPKDRLKLQIKSCFTVPKTPCEVICPASQ